MTEPLYRRLVNAVDDPRSGTLHEHLAAILADDADVQRVFRELADAVERAETAMVDMLRAGIVTADHLSVRLVAALLMPQFVASAVAEGHLQHVEQERKRSC